MFVARWQIDAKFGQKQNVLDLMRRWDQDNVYRASRGLATLQERPELRALAQEHSRNQASQGRMGHTGFQQRMARSRAAGTGARCAENVGHGYRNAQQLFEGWRGSPVHNENMLRPHLRYAAVSVVGAYSTFLACG